MKKLPRVSVHEVPPDDACESCAGLARAAASGIIAPELCTEHRTALPPGVTPICSVKLGAGEPKPAPKRVRVRG